MILEFERRINPIPPSASLSIGKLGKYTVMLPGASEALQVSVDDGNFDVLD